MLDKTEEMRRDEPHRPESTKYFTEPEIAGLSRIVAAIGDEASRDAIALLESAAQGRLATCDEVMRCLRNLRDVLARELSPMVTSTPAPQDLDAAIRYYGARIDELLGSL